MADRGFTSAANRRHLTAGGGRLHPRREAALRLPRGRRRAGPPRPLPGRRPRTCGSRRSRSPSTERFVVCHNPDAADRDAAVRANLVDRLEAMIAGSDRLPPTKRAELRGVISTKPGPEPVPARHPRRAAAHRRREGRRRRQAGREVPAAHLRPAPVHRGHRAGLQAAARGRTRLAGHEAGPGPAPGLPPARGPHPRPRPALLARAAAGPDRRDPRQHPRHGHDLAPRPRPSCSACTSAPSPAPPGCSARPPRPPPRPAGCTRPSTSPCRPGSSTSTPSTPATR